MKPLTVAGVVPPKLSDDCCEIWPRIAPYFRWFAFNDWEDLAAMPHIRDDANSTWRVDYCPSCGKDRRNVINQAAQVIQEAER